MCTFRLRKYARSGSVFKFSTASNCGQLGFFFFVRQFYPTGLRQWQKCQTNRLRLCTSSACVVRHLPWKVIGPLTVDVWPTTKGTHPVLLGLQLGDRGVVDRESHVMCTCHCNRCCLCMRYNGYRMKKRQDLKSRQRTKGAGWKKRGALLIN